MSMYPLILIADDDQVVHESLGLYLSAEGYEHQSAYDGQQALDMVESLHPDMMVLDLMMPRVSGIDVCRTIRQTSNSCPSSCSPPRARRSTGSWAWSWAPTTAS